MGVKFREINSHYDLLLENFISRKFFNESEISKFSHCVELVTLPSETGYCRVIRGLMC